MFRENSRQAKLIEDSYFHGYLLRKDPLIDISKFPFNYSIFDKAIPKNCSIGLVFRLKFDDKYDWIAWKDNHQLFLYVVDRVIFDRNKESILKKECGILLKQDAS